MTLALIILQQDVPQDVVDQFVENLRKGIAETLKATTKSGGKNLADSISAYQESPKIIRVVSSLPHAAAVDRGTPPRVMWELINKVVGLKLPGGITVFRRVSLSAIMRGKWRKPARRGINFVSLGADKAKMGLPMPINFQVVRPPITVLDVM